MTLTQLLSVAKAKGQSSQSGLKIPDDQATLVQMWAPRWEYVA